MSLKCRHVWQATGWLLLGIITYLSLMPHPPEPFTFNQVDKLEHGLAYMTLSLCFCQMYLRSLRWMVLLVVWGIGIEFVQGWTGYRYFDVWDMVANSTGVLLGYFLTEKTPLGGLRTRIEKREEPH
ncbi:MAG: VanZ family protein [Gallionella sp.]|nr:VanZ family protein [Gallionella sp.]